MECHYPPSMESFNREVEKYVQRNKDLAQIFEVYKNVLNVQLEYLDKINVSVNLSEKEIKNCFRNGQYLLSKQNFYPDVSIFKEILSSLSKAIKEASPGAPDSLQQ